MTCEEIRDARLARQWTLGEASRHISTKIGYIVSKVQLKQWENGDRIIPDDLTPECFQ